MASDSHILFGCRCVVPAGYLSPQVIEGGIADISAEQLDFPVQLSELWPDLAQYLHPLCLRSLSLGAHHELSDIHRHVHAGLQYLHVDVVLPCGKRDGKGILRVVVNLPAKPLERVGQTVDVIVDAVDLGSIGQQAIKRADIIIELLLEVRHCVHLLSRPNMPC